MSGVSGPLPPFVGCIASSLSVVSVAIVHAGAWCAVCGGGYIVLLDFL